VLIAEEILVFSLSKLSRPSAGGEPDKVVNVFLKVGKPCRPVLEVVGSGVCFAVGVFDYEVDLVVSLLRRRLCPAVQDSVGLLPQVGMVDTGNCDGFPDLLRETFAPGEGYVCCLD
jgi:hypothetical protein